MKNIYLGMALILLFSNFAAAQANLPDPMSAAPSNSNFYYENKGQIIDQNGNLHPEIRYYTEHAYPQMYLADDKISFVATKLADSNIAGDVDSMGRIDLQFLCNKSVKSQISEKPTAFVPCGVMQTFEPSQDYLNYYLPQCPNGITDVRGYARVVYVDAFPNIDVHFYSNALGVKVYFVIKQGGDPSDIDLLFTGQDSIGNINNGLAMYLGEWKLQFPQAIAYQLAPNNATTVLGWVPAWIHNGSGEVTVATGNYDPNLELVIAIGGWPVIQPKGDNLEWATFYGADGAQDNGRVYVDKDGNLLHVLTEVGNVYMDHVGESYNTNSQNNWYLTKFDVNNARRWSTYYGSTGPDVAVAINEGGELAVGKDDLALGGIWVAGFTAHSGTYWGDALLGTVPGIFQQGANAGLNPNPNHDGLLASFKNDGHLQFGTYLGGGNETDDYISAMDIDPVSNILYIVGNTNKPAQFNNNCNAQTNGDFPLCSGSGSQFFQGAKYNNSDREGFIAAFDLEDMSLIWSTLFGGAGEDYIQSLKVVHNATENAIYIGGLTASVYRGDGEISGAITSHPLNSFPLVNPGNGAFFQYSVNSTSAPFNNFVARFNGDRQLEWCTYFGHSTGGIKNIAVNSSNEIYIIGNGSNKDYAAASSPTSNANGLIPVYDNSNSYYEAPSDYQQHLVLARFGSDLKLKWSTFLHGGWEPSYGIMRKVPLAVDAIDRVYVGTFLKKVVVPVLQLPGAYWQYQNASMNSNISSPLEYPYDSYILAFDPSEHLFWATFLGGTLSSASELNVASTSSDFFTDIAASGSNYLYFTGETQCEHSPYTECPQGAYCDQSYNSPGAGDDCFIGKFITSSFPTNVKTVQEEAVCLNVYPNPSSTVFYVSFLNRDFSALGDEVKISIINGLGSKVSETSLTMKTGINRFALNCKNLPSGVYFLKLGNKKFEKAIKIIKK